MTDVLRISEARAVERAASALASGGMVAFPTDTVYGLGVSAWNAEAIDRIYAAKGRPAERALPVLLSDPEEIDRVCRQLPAAALRLARAFWPGPLTIVIARRAELPANLGPGSTVGVRVPDHESARRLLRAAGPLAVTSANRSGEAPSLSAAEVVTSLGGRIDLVLDGGPSPGGVPSTVVDCTGAEIYLWRQGPISRAEILRTLEAEA
jgi:L-threonylcarbamoyladenylate synthase